MKAKGKHKTENKKNKASSTKQKIKKIKPQAQKAFKFVEIFGLDLQLLKLKDPNRTTSFFIDFSTTDHSNLQQEPW